MSETRHTRMKPETLEALRGSIAKWEGIVAGTVANEGGDNCPLCVRFNHYQNPGMMPGCYGCPVRQHTGKPGCVDTPYFAYADYELDVDDGVADEDPVRRRELAQAELDFLKSLLPEAQSDEEKTHG